MIACRSFFRVNLLVRESSNTYVRSKPFQDHKFWHGISGELIMDNTKRVGDGYGRRKPKNASQSWRAVSAQPNYSRGDGEKGKLKVQLEEMHSTISSAASVAQCGTDKSESSNKPVGPDACLVKEAGKISVSLDENLMISEKHSVSMEIGASLMRFIKGKWGVTQKKIEEETGVKIIFPPSRNEDSIIIEGSSAESVTLASEKIQSIIDKTVNSRDLDYSHFVSLPLAIHPGLVDKLFNFQNSILGIAASGEHKNLESDSGGDKSAEKGFGVADTQVIPLVSYRPKKSLNSAPEISSKLIDLGIEQSIFIKPQTFHLTVLMLKLWNKDRLKTAAEVLQSISSKVLDALENMPVLIRLKGLECMKGSKADARVIYAPVEEIGHEGRLLRACKVITDAFIEAGLVMERDQQHQLKLHATLMNARHRKRNPRGMVTYTTPRNMDTFDARGIFELYGSKEWGEYCIREAHLSQRFAFDENGYYHCCASIPFPENIQVDCYP